MKSLRSIILSLAVLIIALSIAYYVVIYLPQKENRNQCNADRREEASNVVEWGGVVRASADGTWHILDNPGHMPICLSAVIQTEEYIAIKFCDKLKQIHWQIVNPDEYLVQHHFDVGVSGGLDGAYVYFAKDGKPINPNIITEATANVWVYVKGER